MPLYGAMRRGWEAAEVADVAEVADIAKAWGGERAMFFAARIGIAGVRRMVVFLVGLIFVVVGAIALPLPIPFGALMFVLGFALIVMSSKRVRTWFHAWRLRSPWLDALLRKFEHWLPVTLRRALNPRERGQ